MVFYATTEQERHKKHFRRVKVQRVLLGPFKISNYFAAVISWHWDLQNSDEHLTSILLLTGKIAQTVPCPPSSVSNIQVSFRIF